MSERHITITLTEQDGNQSITMDPSGFSPLEVLGVLRYECLRHEACLVHAPSVNVEKKLYNVVPFNQPKETTNE